MCSKNVYNGSLTTFYVNPTLKNIIEKHDRKTQQNEEVKGYKDILTNVWDDFEEKIKFFSKQYNELDIFVSTYTFTEELLQALIVLVKESEEEVESDIKIKIHFIYNEDEHNTKNLDRYSKEYNFLELYPIDFSKNNLFSKQHSKVYFIVGRDSEKLN